MLGWVWKRRRIIVTIPTQAVFPNQRQAGGHKESEGYEKLGGVVQTLHVATPNITAILEPFESSSAGKDTKEQFI